VDNGELLGVIEWLVGYGIAADRGRDVERVNFSKWQETVKLATPKDKRHIGISYGDVIDGRTLPRLYKEPQEAHLKRSQAAGEKRAQLAAVQSLPRLL